MTAVIQYAVLCGAASEDYRQKKFMETYDALISGASGVAVPAENIIVFPCGAHELMLEQVLNGLLDDISDDGEPREVLLYLCALQAGDAEATLPSTDCPVVRLGDTEIRKDVIAYYVSLFGQLGSRLTVRYDSDGELVDEQALGYEAV